MENIELRVNNVSVVDKKRIKKVLIVLPLHREGLTSFLSPILGQYGIRNNDFISNFITKFNIDTKGIFVNDISGDDIELGLSDEELLVPIFLYVYKGGKYEIKIQNPQIGSVYGIRFKKIRRYYKKNSVYRNYKKLLQLTVFSYYNDENKKNWSISSLQLKNKYLQIRNAVQNKR